MLVYEVYGLKEKEYAGESVEFQKVYDNKVGVLHYRREVNPFSALSKLSITFLYYILGADKFRISLMRNANLKRYWSFFVFGRRTKKKRARRSRNGRT